MLFKIEIEKFSLGRVIISREASESLHPDDVRAALRRHAMGDWGEYDPEDCQKNNVHLREGGLLGSIYIDRHGKQFCIFTEEGRLTTTIGFPDDL